MLGCWSRAASRASRRNRSRRSALSTRRTLSATCALGHRVERQIEHAHATVRNALTDLVAADCRGWRGQCADYTHRPPRRPRGGRPSDCKESSHVFRRASVLLVAAAFALGGCSRQAADAHGRAGDRRGSRRGGQRRSTPAHRRADGGLAAAPASAGPAADDGRRRGSGLERPGRAGGGRRRQGPVPVEGRGPRPALSVRHHPRARRPRPGAAAVGRARRSARRRGLHRDPHGQRARRWASWAR